MTETTPLAVVTGASRGIGLELARQFVQHGFDPLINAEDGAIQEAAAQLRIDLLHTNVGQSNKDSAEDVAKQGFEALMTGKDKFVAASMQTKAQAAANAVLPDKVKAAATG